MSESVEIRLQQAVQSAEMMYNRLILLVGEPGSGKTKALRGLAKSLGRQVINVNLELSKVLLGLTARQRALELPNILENLVEEVGTPVLLDNLEILFDRSLAQNPFALLQRISRNQVVVASWNGAIHDKKLIYASSEHPEYRQYDPDGVMIIEMKAI